MVYTHPNSLQDAISIGLEKSISASILAAVVTAAAVILHLVCTFPGLPRAISTGDAIFIAFLICVASLFYELLLSYDNPVGTAEQFKLVMTVSSIRGYVLTVILVLVVRVWSVFGESKVETSGAKENTSTKKDS